MKRIRNLAVCSTPVFLVVLLLGPVVTPLAKAQTFSVLHSFKGNLDGADPEAGLVQDTFNGDLYGTTARGGNTNAGTAFAVNPNGGGERVVHSFTQNHRDGSFPMARLSISNAGQFFGTTYQGGPADAGTVFQMGPNGRERVIYAFLGGKNGQGLVGHVIRDPVGNLYGTTRYGGDLSCENGMGCGMVFKLDANGRPTILYRFTGGSDGGEPLGGLVRDSANNLYGTTLYGGNASACTSAPTGCGVVFKVDQLGNETVLYSFAGGTDGAGPRAGLIWDTIGGNLYGTTSSGGAHDAGTVFMMDTTGTESLLYSFKGGADGAFPYASLIRDSSGNLIGTTNLGGKPGCAGLRSGCGVVFKIDSARRETVLYTFQGRGDGGLPLAPLIQDASGNLYGTASIGGNFKTCGAGCGVVFKIAPF